MQRRFLVTVQVITAFAVAGFTVGFKGFGDQIKVVGFRSEVAELFALFGEFGNRVFHGGAIIAMEAITFDDQWFDFFPEENVLKSIFNSRGTSAGRAGNSDHGMFGGHAYSFNTRSF